MFDLNDYTIWNETTGEIYSVGRAIQDKAAPPEGHAVYWGEQINWETHVFDENGVPTLRTVPRPVSAEEFSSLVNKERQRRIITGKDFDGIWVTGEDRDQVNLLALKDTARDLLAAGVTAPIIPFRDGLNVEHLLTAEQIITLANAGKIYVSSIYQASWAIKAMEPLPTDVTDDALWPG